MTPNRQPKTLNAPLQGSRSEAASWLSRGTPPASTKNPRISSLPSTMAARRSSAGTTTRPGVSRSCADTGGVRVRVRIRVEEGWTTTRVRLRTSRCADIGGARAKVVIGGVADVETTVKD